MIKYIDAEKLKTKIKGLQCEQGFEDGMEERAYQLAIKDILDIINSIQQEQPCEGLESEIEKYFQGLWPGMETTEQCNTDMHFTPPAIMRLARYFYNIGRQSKK